VISSHSNRPFACPHCPHRSKTQEKLDRHVFACHLAKANANYSCPHCNQKFAFKNSMKKHLYMGRCGALKRLSGHHKKSRKKSESAGNLTSATTTLNPSQILTNPS